MTNGTTAHRHAPTTDRGTDWRDLGLCRESDPDLWFADGSSAAEVSDTEYAKSVCAVCPSRVPCASWALEYPRPIAGVWGGLTEAERRAIKRSETRARNRASA